MLHLDLNSSKDINRKCNGLMLYKYISEDMQEMPQSSNTVFPMDHKER